MSIRAEIAATFRSVLAVLGILRAPQPATLDRCGKYDEVFRNSNAR